MKNILPFILSFISFSTQASYLDNLVNDFNSINSGQLSCQSENDKNLQECALALCGASGDLKTSFVSNEELEKFQLSADGKKRQEQFKASLNEYFDGVEKSNKSLYDSLTADLKDPNFLDALDAEGLNQISEMYYKDKLQVEIIRDGANKVVKMTTLAQGLSPEEKLGLEEYAKEWSKTIKSDFKAGVEAGYLSSAEAKDQILKSVLEVEKRPDSKEESGMLKSIKEGLASKNPDTQTLLTAYEDLKIVEARVNQTDYPSSPKKLCGTSCQKGVASLVQKENFPRLMWLLKKNTNPENRNKLIQNCQSLVAMSEFLNIPEEKQQKSRELFKKTMTKIETNLLTKISQESSQHVKKRLNEIKLRFDNPYRKTLDDIEVNMKMKSAISEGLPQGNIANKIATVKSMFDSEGTPKPYQAKELGCELRGHSMASDAYDSQAHSISVSKFVALNPVEGESIMAHELGHAFSYMMKEGISEQSGKAFRDFRGCVNSLYKTSVKGPEYQHHVHAGDHTTCEEDMADVVQFIAAPTARPAMCNLLRPGGDGITFSELTLDHESNDVHSDLLFRVIHGAYYQSKGNLPEVCLNALKSSPVTRELKTCSL